MTLDEAQESYYSEPNHETLIEYLRVLVQYEQDEMIGMDTFISEVALIVDEADGGLNL